MVPIILFCYNRPDHTKRTVNSLLQNPEAASSNLFVFVDGPKTPSDKPKVDQVISFLKSVEGFKSTTIKSSKVNKGLAQSVISGVSQVFERYTEAIVLEDDLIFSSDFLKFMNKALAIYRDHSKVGSVSGYSYKVTIPPSYAHDVFLSKRVSSWGWGTWKNRWDNVDWELNDFDNFISDKKAKNRFKLGGEDYLPMLMKWYKGVIDSWAIRWAFHHFKHEQYCLVPRLSKVQNIGTDGSGSNFTHKETKYNVDMGESELELPQDISPSDSILRQFQSRYSPSVIRRIINRIKYGV